MATRSRNFKICDTVSEALEGCGRGATIMVGGFGHSGIPENIIEHVREQPEINDLKIISTEAGDDGWGLGRLYEKNRISKQWVSYIGRAKGMEQAYLSGKTELELIPQGALAEKVRCCGSGIPAFYSVTGLHTLFGDGKLPTKYNSDGSVAKYNTKRETRDFGGKTFMLEEAFEPAEFAWIKATKADKMGNLFFKGTSYNFNAIMAKAAKTVIVEAEEIVEIGDIPPEQVHVPGLYVNRLFKGETYQHKIEVLKTLSDDTSKKDPDAAKTSEDPREMIAHVAAQEFKTGMNCNLGVGIPTMAAGFAASMGIHVFLQSENGMTGCGPYPEKGKEDSDWINAGKETVTVLPGGSTFGSDESFGQIRGGHLDMTVLGHCDIKNTPPIEFALLTIAMKTFKSASTPQYKYTVGRSITHEPHLSRAVCLIDPRRHFATKGAHQRHLPTMTEHPKPSEPRKADIYKFEQENGTFKRQVSSFRSWISSEPGAPFPPEKDRYVLYINLGCPWASRANLVRTLKGLEEIIQIVILDWELFPEGWSFTGRDGSDRVDPLYGFTRLSELYFKAEPDYSARFTVPVLWDKKSETIVSNESSEIIRMFYSEFDSLLPPNLRETSKPNGGLLPSHLKEEIDEMNDWIYNTINNGVYKSGFADTQEGYETNVIALFKSLDRVEDILAKSQGKYLFGDHLTDADIRLYPTIVRFDVAYHTLFMCNLKMIRYEYPHIQKWLMRLYWDESDETKGAFRKSTNFDAIKRGYAHTPRKQHTPIGPAVNILSL